MEQIQQRLEKLKQKQKGFTLVELIVVIAIIGVLAGIMLPKYFSFTDDARKSAVIAEAKNIRSIAETYYANNGTWPTITIASSAVTLQGDTTAYQGTISSYDIAAAGTAVATAAVISTDGSFNYTKTGNAWIASCNSSGSVIARKGP